MKNPRIAAFASLAPLAAILPLATLGAAPLPPAKEKPVQRCGWVQNPTPGNWYLVDRSGEWVMGEQGGYQAPGMDRIPDLTVSRWVTTNGSYGYGCGCVTGNFDAKSKRVTRIASFKQKAIAACRADKKLPRP